MWSLVLTPYPVHQWASGSLLTKMRKKSAEAPLVKAGEWFNSEGTLPDPRYFFQNPWFSTGSIHELGTNIRGWDYGFANCSFFDCHTFPALFWSSVKEGTQDPCPYKVAPPVMLPQGTENVFFFISLISLWRMFFVGYSSCFLLK
jgi:hypothetical protein